MLALEFTAGSPFARAVRILLDELGLEYRRIELDAAPSAERADGFPTLQVPALSDGELKLWESGLIADYLLKTTPARRKSAPPLAGSLWRPEAEWRDKLVFATIQTFGTAVTTISQMTWTGVRVTANGHLDRCADRARAILAWLEDELTEDVPGFLPGLLSAQDIFLACHIRFVEARPIGLDLGLERLPGIASLLAALDQRESFRANPVWWWDEAVTGYAPDGRPLYDPQPSGG